jgi:hypothetical protein
MVDAGLVPDPGTIIDQLEQELQVMAGLPLSGVRRPRRPGSRTGHAPRRTRSDSNKQHSSA